MERERGIEPPYIAWKAIVLPLNYSRISRYILLTVNCEPQTKWWAGRDSRVPRFNFLMLLNEGRIPRLYHYNSRAEGNLRPNPYLINLLLFSALKLFISTSLLWALDLLINFSVYSNSTGFLALVYFEALPLLCFCSLLLTLVVIPV